MKSDEEQNEEVTGLSSYEVPKTGGPIGCLMADFWRGLDTLVRTHKKSFNWLVLFAFYGVCIAYIVGAFYTYGQYHKNDDIDWCNGYGLLFILFALVGWCILYYNLVKPIVVKYELCLPLSKFLASKRFQKVWSYLQIVLLLGIFGGFLTYMIIDTSSDRRRLLSGVGWVFYFFIGFFFSKFPEYIRWRTVFKGFATQIVIALIIIKWETGRNIFLCLGNQVEAFLGYAYQGAAFVYGDELVNVLKLFAFEAMSVLYFIAMIVHILFYYGWLQVFCFKIGGWMQFLIGTTIIESVNAITTIFLGMGEVTFVYESYVKDLTKSELHAVMAANFAAVSGSMLAAYTSLGAETSNLITASCMAAPTALAFAKLFYPETKTSKTSSDTIVHHKSDDDNVLDAACKGAFSAISIIQSIIANLVACVSLVAFFNGILSYLGVLIGLPQLSFNYALGKVFVPLAYLMGVTPSQTETVATLIGLKTTVNEFVAYQQMGKYKAAGLLTPRSEAIATFALCGFANPGSMSILLAVLSNFAPNQRQNITKVVFRSFVSGSCVTFMSACLVGMMMPENGF